MINITLTDFYIICVAAILLWLTIISKPPFYGGIYVITNDYDNTSLVPKYIGMEPNLEYIIFKPDVIYPLKKFGITNYTYNFIHQHQQWFVTIINSNSLTIKTPCNKFYTYYIV